MPSPAEVATPLLGVRTHAMTVWRAVPRLGAAAQAHTDALSTYHAAPASVAAVAAAPPPTGVIAVDGGGFGTQGLSTRRRRPTKTPPLPSLPPVPDGTFREVKTVVLLLPTDRVALPDRAALIRRVVVTGLTPRAPDAAAARDAVVRYYTTHAHRMHSDDYLRRGYGLGSGAVERAHKQVVHARLRQSGMRWSVRGAPHVLALRALLLNGTWAQTDHPRLARRAA
jgi:hypothetical protein